MRASGYTRRMSTTFRFPLRPLLLAAVLPVLAGCGNKGPLVMPQKPVPVQTTAPAPTQPPEQSLQPEDAQPPADKGDRSDDDDQ